MVLPLLELEPFLLMADDSLPPVRTASVPPTTALSPSGAVCLAPDVATAARSKRYWQILGITPRCAPLPTPTPKTGDNLSAAGDNPSAAFPFPFSVSWASPDILSRSVTRDDDDGDDGGEVDCGDTDEIRGGGLPGVEGVGSAAERGAAAGSAPPTIVNVFPEPVCP